MAREITSNNFEISLVVFMPNITTNHAITYTNSCINPPDNNIVMFSTFKSLVHKGSSITLLMYLYKYHFN